MPPRAGTGGALPDPPTRLFALQKDVIAVAFGTTLRAYDMRYVPGCILRMHHSAGGTGMLQVPRACCTDAGHVS